MFVSSDCEKTIIHNGQQLNLILWDTAGGASEVVIASDSDESLTRFWGLRMSLELKRRYESDKSRS